MSDQFTPAPWGCWGYRVVSEIDSQQVANTELMRRESYDAGHNEAIANARLIAAAPDMIAALDRYADELCEGWCEQCPEWAHYQDCSGCMARRIAWQARGGEA